jgi:hypothetical protein
VAHLIEANCECGASWNLITDDDPEEFEVECTACGATVVDVRDLGLHHSAGRDVEP